MNTSAINSQIFIEESDNQFCLVKSTGKNEKKSILCFHSFIDVFSYCRERNIDSAIFIDEQE